MLWKLMRRTVKKIMDKGENENAWEEPIRNWFKHELQGQEELIKVASKPMFDPKIVETCARSLQNAIRMKEHHIARILLEDPTKRDRIMQLMFEISSMFKRSSKKES